MSEVSSDRLGRFVQPSGNARYFNSSAETATLARRLQSPCFARGRGEC